MQQNLSWFFEKINRFGKTFISFTKKKEKTRKLLKSEIKVRILLISLQQ